MGYIFIDALHVLDIVLCINKMEDKYIRYITVDDEMKGSYIIHRLTKEKCLEYISTIDVQNIT